MLHPEAGKVSPCNPLVGHQVEPVSNKKKKKKKKKKNGNMASPIPYIEVPMKKNENMASPIPYIQVPMNFGLEYLGSPSHGNLKFLLKDEELLANSAIMSYNSPVIKKMTVELFQTEIPVKDFSKYAVECFLEASYSGVLEKLSKSNFRDLNKMACVFEVDWLIERCFEYFLELTKSVKEDNFEDQLFLFDEAMFVMDKRKKRRLLDIVIKQFASLETCTPYFATQYLKDLPSCPKNNLEVIMKMAADQEHIFVEALLNNLENNKCTVDQNSRCIIERLNYKSSLYSSEAGYQRLFEKLEEVENPSTEDFRLITRALKQYNNAQKENNTSIACTALPNNRALIEANTVIPYAALPNLFHDFKQVKEIKSLEALTNFLIQSPLVVNSYMFYDAVYIWLLNKLANIPFVRNSTYSNAISMTPSVCISDNFVEIFSDLMMSRGWKPIDLNYTNNDDGPRMCYLKTKIQNHPNLVTNANFNRIPSISEYTPGELFARGHDIKFKYRQKSITKCSKEGDCGFILRVTPATGKDDDSFNLQLVTDPNLYPDDIHFHRESHMLADNLHFTINVTISYNSSFTCYTEQACPLTWCGKPQLDGTNKYWCWGTERFYNKGEGSYPQGYVYSWAKYNGDTVKIRPVVYYTG